MITTLNEICASGLNQERWKKLLKHLGKTEADDEPLPYTTIIESNGLEDALWVLGRLHPKKSRLLAVRYARHVQHLMKDPRSLNALDAVEQYVKGEASDEELAAAWASAMDAVKAAARDAAAAAAEDAARAAAWVEAAAATAASAAAWAAAGAAGESAARDAAASAARDAAAAAAWAAAAAAAEPSAEASAWSAAGAEALDAERHEQERMFREILNEFNEFEEKKNVA